MNKIVSIAALFMTGVPAVAALAEYGEPQNPANGIWIQQVGELEPQDPTSATLYYTKYEKDQVGDRVKSISYTYNGAGFLLMKPSDRKTLCTQDEGIEGADGIVHHPDGEHLLVAGQGQRVYMVKKETATGEKCLVKRAGLVNAQGAGVWHLMMDYNQKWLWGANIPGELFRFSTDMRTENGVLAQSHGFGDNGYRVTVKADSKKHSTDNTLSTIIWDDYGRAYFTRSDYFGGGCEGSGCTPEERARRRQNSYFGVLVDTVKTVVTAGNRNKIGGFVGDTVITSLTKKVLIDALEGAHGGTYDKYSGTIFLFGGAKIVQIAPYDASGALNPQVVATIDLRDFFFEDSGFNGQNKTYGVGGWRLDQGTTDGLGHLFVASNTGHMVFVDFAGNSQKRIDNNVFVHVQWMDAYLDDLAPLVGVGANHAGGTVGNNDVASSSSNRSSSSMVIRSSSSAKSSSSVSSSGSTPGSSGSDPSSSGSTPGSSGSTPGSSGSTPGSSGSTPGSSGSTPGSSGSTPGSSGSTPGSSGSTPGSSGSTPGSSGSTPGSSGSTPGSSGSTPGSSGSTPGSSGSTPGSSSGGNGGSGEMDDESSSSSNLYYNAEDDYVNDDGYEAYPSVDAFDKGDTIVSGATVLEPTKPGSTDPNAVVIGGDSYLPSKDPSDMKDFRHDGSNEAIVGDIVAITLDPTKVSEYFGSIDSLKVVATDNLELVDPADGSKKETIFVNNDGSVTILVTADEAVQPGSIKIYGNGNVVIIDNINFVDPTPDARIGYIKDTDGNDTLDYVEILLKEPLDSNAVVDQVRLVIGGDTLACSNNALNDSRERISVDVDDLKKKLPDMGKFPEDASVLVTYKYTRGTSEDGSPKTTTYVREAPLLDGIHLIKDAFAIRDTLNPKNKETNFDSLFIQFNIDLVPADVRTPEMLVLLKDELCRSKVVYDSAANRCALDNVKKVYMPAKDIIILVGKDFGLKGNLKDSVSLHDAASFRNLEYITSDEYEREVPVTVVDRFPSVVNVEYWDTEGNGVLDQIVAVFDSPLTEEDIENTLHFTFPWYSNRGMLTQMQVYPSSLTIDPDDPTRVIWKVVSTVPLDTGLTSISDKLPDATVFTYYPIFGETFVSEASAKLVDKMAPIVSTATLSYGKKADTLQVTFSEPIDWKSLKGDDYFYVIHGNDTLHLDPIDLSWSADGRTAKLILSGSDVTILPGDFLLVKRGKYNKSKDEYDAIKDEWGNITGEKPQPVIIGGLLNHMVESTKMGTFDPNDSEEKDAGDTTYVMRTVSSVNLRYVPSSTTKEDMEKEGALGHLVQLGERFVPQLVDRAQVSSDGTYDPAVLDSLDPKDVLISFVVNFTDHLGQFVNDTVIVVECNSPKFNYNCLSTDKKVFVNWNFKDYNNRFVGSGVYTVQFKMVVRYKDKKIEEEMKDKWGVRRKKHRKK
ncbi:MAG: hypothetical protein HUK19_02030 [Fibrobacter sp.]|nr:hypothetical protein [Fibrobacter sp.]